MELARLEKELKAHGVKVGMMSRKLYEQLAAYIPDDAPVVAAAEGVAGTSKQPIIVTPKALYIAVYPSMVSFPEINVVSRSEVSGIQVQGGLLATLTIRTASGQYVIAKIPGPMAGKVAAGLPVG